MNVQWVCDYCEFVGSREEYYKHRQLSAKCDDRPACCKIEEIDEYEQFEAWEICDDCYKKIDYYYEDLHTDALMESYYEGRY